VLRPSTEIESLLGKWNQHGRLVPHFKGGYINVCIKFSCIHFHTTTVQGEKKIVPRTCEHHNKVMAWLDIAHWNLKMCITTGCSIHLGIKARCPRVGCLLICIPVVLNQFLIGRWRWMVRSEHTNLQAWFTFRVSAGWTPRLDTREWIFRFPPPPPPPHTNFGTIYVTHVKPTFCLSVIIQPAATGAVPSP
jgi:hypothetical protein